MKSNKSLIFAAILLVLTVTLAACGDNTATTASATVPASAPTTAAAPASATTAAMTTAAMTTAAMTTPAATTAAMTTAASTTMAMTTAAGMTTSATTTSASMTSAASGKMMAITISNFAFAPDTITIPVGTTVVWTNKDSVGHTVTSDDSGGPLKSSLINQNTTFQYTFDKAGTYTYHCEPHPFMKATIIVQ